MKFHRLLYCLLQVDDLRGARGIRNLPKLRTISVGWKHRYAESDPYMQQKHPIGGIKKISLQSEKLYTVQDIVDKVEPLFTNAKAKELFRKSKRPIKLGLFQDFGIANFVDGKNKEIGLFEFFSLHNLSFTKNNLYLFTTIKEKYVSTYLGLCREDFSDSSYSKDEEELSEEENKSTRTPQNSHALFSKTHANDYSASESCEKLKLINTKFDLNKKCKFYQKK